MTNMEEWNRHADEVLARANALGILNESLSTVLKNQYNDLLETYPNFLPYYQPRHVHSPGGYASFKCVAGGLFTVISEVLWKHEHHVEQAPTDIVATSVAYQVVNYSVPVYYVADDFIRAVAATELPKDMLVSDINFPMPAFVLGFPEQFMREYLGRDLCYVLAGDFKDNQVVTCPKLGRHYITVPKGKVAWAWYTKEMGKTLEMFVGTYFHEDRVGEALTKYDYYDYTKGSGTQEKLNSDTEMCDKMSALMFKLLLVMAVRPTLITPGQCERRAKFSKGVKKYDELWGPHMIGHGYKVIRAPAQGGTHASPRWHWRRGHFTHQRIGSPKDTRFVSVGSLPRTPDGQIDWQKVTPEARENFWAGHRRLWLEPTLVNFENEATKG